MPVLQRSSAPRGARFYEDAGELMFVNVLDACTWDGPRAATDEDRLDHPDPWARYEAGQPDPAADFAPMITFSTPEEIQAQLKAEAPTKAKGERAPV